MGFLDSMKSRLGFGAEERWDDEGGYPDRRDDGQYDERDYYVDDDYAAPAARSAYDHESYPERERPGVRLVSREPEVAPRSSRYGASSYGSSSFGTRSSYGSTYDNVSSAPASAGTGASDTGRIGASSASEPEFMRNRPQGISDRRSTVVSLTDERGKRTAGRNPFDEYLQTPRTPVHEASLKIITPASYSEAEGIAVAFKAGTNVVLSLKETRSELAKRILDFSFGVATALGGNVEKVADKVFLLSHTPGGLTTTEQQQLKDAGILH